ncbi:hypothetical protein TQ36_26700 [Burkholderia cenocepacia]|nr:hypothetical protein TQ36_26700 [Burkholderia cenocepacia]
MAISRTRFSRRQRPERCRRRSAPRADATHRGEPVATMAAGPGLARTSVTSQRRIGITRRPRNDTILPVVEAVHPSNGHGSRHARSPHPTPSASLLPPSAKSLSKLLRSPLPAAPLTCSKRRRHAGCLASGTTAAAITTTASR